MREKITYTFYSKNKKTNEVINHGESARPLYVWLWFQLDKKQVEKIHYVVGSNGVVYYSCPFRYSFTGNIRKVVADMQKELENERKNG